MSAQKGDSILLKLGDSNSPGTFTAVAGLRTKTLTINHETVDVTSADDTQKWRQLLEGAGIRSMEVSGSGVFKDGTVSDDVNTIAVSGVHRVWQLVVPGLGTFEGSFQITSMAYAGEYNAEVTWDMSLASADDIAFTAN